MMRILISLFALTFYYIQVHATLYYVSPEGSDHNNGLSDSPSGSWKTLQTAIRNVKAGDHVIVDDGTYTTDGFFFESLNGQEKKPIIFTANNQHGAKLTRHNKADPKRSVVEFNQSSYIILDGFEIYDTIEGNESGVDIRGNSHHISILNCYIRDCACGGISSRMSDYLRIESNIVRGNAKRNKWNCSGISVWHAIEHDQEEGFHIVIKNNVAFENECTLPFTPMGFDFPTDGNGIIIDDLRSKQEVAKGQEGGYQSKILIEGNLCFDNGGRGFNIYESSNVVLRNNTSFYNQRITSQHKEDFGEITLQNASKNIVEGNLLISNPAYPTYAFAVHCYQPKESNQNIVKNNKFSGDYLYCGGDLTTRNNQSIEVPNLGNLIKSETFDSSDFKTIQHFRNYFDFKKRITTLDE